jgi:hypothetical protein
MKFKDFMRKLGKVAAKVGIQTAMDNIVNKNKPITAGNTIVPGVKGAAGAVIGEVIDEITKKKDE